MNMINTDNIIHSYFPFLGQRREVGSLSLDDGVLQLPRWVQHEPGEQPGLEPRHRIPLPR
jgi:hypothetical protein